MSAKKNLFYLFFFCFKRSLFTDKYLEKCKIILEKCKKYDLTRKDAKVQVNINDKKFPALRKKYRLSIVSEQSSNASR